MKAPATPHCCAASATAPGCPALTCPQVAQACKAHAAALGLDPAILRFNGVNAQVWTARRCTPQPAAAAERLEPGPSMVCPCLCLPLHQPLGRPLPASSRSYPALPPPALLRSRSSTRCWRFCGGTAPARAAPRRPSWNCLQRCDRREGTCCASCCWQPCNAGLSQQSRHPARNAEPVEAPGSGVGERVSRHPSLPACVCCRMRWWRRWSTWRLARRL